MKSPFDYDRRSTNDSDGKTFYGVDEPDTGKTIWYDESGEIDSIGDMPGEFDYDPE
ncbi:MAG: hypothetical protein PUK54_09050 [Firmicutes bacterium]|nr:hypothetical protein [Bacillota bacterium]MDY5857517.1 hypothetical protein [Anaerovoracaceae bacterium]